MTRQNQSLIFPLLFVMYEIATYLSNDMYLPALPQMMQDLGLTTSTAQLTLTVWFLGSAITPLLMGALSDRFGRRATLLTGGLIYIVATLFCAMTSNIIHLLIARFIEGGMIPSMMVAGYACIHESYEQKQAIRILALMASISVLAPACGPLLGSIVLYFSTWRGIFWFIALWATIIILLLYKFMPETLPPEKRQSLHLMVLCNQYKNVITNLHFLLYTSILGFSFAGFLAWIAAGPFLVMVSFHLSAVVFGIIQVIIFSTNIFANRLVKYLLEPLGVFGLIQWGLWISLLGGMLAFIFALVAPHSLYAFLMAMMIYSFGSGLNFSSLNRVSVESSSEPMGIRVALFTISLTGFAALGSGMASLFFNGEILSLAILICLASMISFLIKWLARPKQLPVIT